MILINLLPHREAARKRQKERFFSHLGLSALLGGAVCGLVFTWYQGQISSQQSRNRFLQAEIAKLDVQIKDIASLQTEIASLRSRQTAVENLQGDRNLPVHLLDELVTQVPEGIHLVSMKQDNQTVLIKGVAQSQERVSDLLRNLANRSEWLTKPDLVEIVAVKMNTSNRDQRRVSNFTVRFSLKRPTAANAAPVPASRPAPAVPGKV